MLRTLADSLLVLTISGNVILGLLLVYNHWWVRYNWLTLSAILSVLADFVLQYLHFNTHSAYEPVRQFLFYALWLILDVLVIWEAYRLRNKVVQYCTEVQLGLAILWPMLKRAELHWTAYWLCEFSLIFNVFCIGWFIVIFRKEARYAND